MEITTTSTKETKELAKQLAKDIKEGDVIALYGDLGSGKTTFTKYFVEALDISSRVQSPTFVIHRVYKNDKITVNHLDLYRLSTKEEVLDMGIEETFEEGIAIIEWPEVIEEVLPANTKRIYFEYIDENKRLINVQ